MRVSPDRRGSRSTLDGQAELRAPCSHGDAEDDGVGRRERVAPVVVVALDLPPVGAVAADEPVDHVAVHALGPVDDDVAELGLPQRATTRSPVL